jgi:outer membrane protein
MRWISLALVAALQVTGTVAGAEELTLPAAVGTALEHSPALLSARSSAEAAVARSKQARGFQLPSIDLTEMFNRTDSPAEAFALQLNQERFDFGSFVEGDPNNPDPLNTWMTRLEVTQPVYTGGKLSSRISQAELMATAEELTAGHEAEQVAFDTSTAFVNLAKAREFLGLLTAARETTAAHVKLARQYASEGLIVKAEVLKAEVYLAQMDEMVAQASTGAELALAALNFHMGVDQSREWSLAPLPSPPPVAPRLDGWVTAALDQRQDLEAARSKVEAGRLEEKVARSGFMPEIAVVGRLDFYDDTIFGSHGDSSTLMAVAKINLYRGGADREALAASRHDTAAHEADVHRFEEGIRLQVRQAWQELATARARRDTARSSLESAREALRVTEERFRQGLDKMIDLLDAETALREAEVRELVARYDVVLSSYSLYFASGTSLVELTHPSEDPS